MTWRTLPAPDSTFGLNIFVAADDPLTVGKVRARFPGNAVWALDRPPHCNFGYNTARSEECMVYAVADLFLLARNPGPLLRSAFSSFSEYADHYRRHTGRAAGSYISPLLSYKPEPFYN